VITILHTPPELVPDPQHGWQMTFWLGDGFDYSTPSRAAVQEVDAILKQTAPVVIDLPPHHPDKDFVEGSLMFGDSSLRVYYAYSLGYLSLTSAGHAVLKDVASRVLSSVRLANRNV
jgi:hypothetical protein